MTRECDKLTRRRVLTAGCAISAGTLLSGCAGPIRSTPNQAYLRTPEAPKGGRVAFTAYETDNMRAAAEHVLARVDDMRWLGLGESVFVKVACNSPYVHPAVTAPLAIEAVVAMLRDRGAGTIYVGDQSGVEHVRRRAGDRVASTREMMQRNGLLKAVQRSGAKLHNFDDQGWDKGYELLAPDFDDHWEGKLAVARILEQVDHVVVLSRLGAHALAGYSGAIKNAVGWLRDDSRMVLHQRADTFFEKIAEINHCQPLRDKVRLALTLGDKALLNVGPDMGGTYEFHSCVAFASKRLVDHDAFASALLGYLETQNVSVFGAYAPYPDHADFWNRGFVEDMWGEDALRRYQPLMAYPLRRGIEFDAALSRLAALQSYRPARIVVDANPTYMADDLRAHLCGYGDGLFVV